MRFALSVSLVLGIAISACSSDGADPTDDGSGGSGGEGGGGSGGGPVDFSCEVTDAPAPCEGDGCAITHSYAITCTEPAIVRAELEPDGVPTAFVKGRDNWLRVDARTLSTTELDVSAPFGRPALNENGDWYLFTVSEESHTWSSFGTVEQTIAEQPGGYLSLHAADSESGHIVSLTSDDTGSYRLARLTGGAFAEDNIAPQGEKPTLELAEDGSLIIGDFGSAGGGWQAAIRTGPNLEQTETLPFEIGSVLETGMVIAAGQTTWLAAAMQLDDGLHVAFPDGTGLIIEDSPRLVVPNCAFDAQGSCPESCTDSAYGVAGAVALSHEGTAFIAIAVIDLERTWSLDNSCSEAGCTCSKLDVANDNTIAELVIIELNVLGATEKLRVPIDYQYGMQMEAVERDGIASIVAGETLLGVDLSLL